MFLLKNIFNKILTENAKLEKIYLLSVSFSKFPVILTFTVSVGENIKGWNAKYMTSVDEKVPFVAWNFVDLFMIKNNTLIVLFLHFL